MVAILIGIGIMLDNPGGLSGGIDCDAHSVVQQFHADGNNYGH
jgi:hypothetical protein